MAVTLLEKEECESQALKDRIEEEELERRAQLAEERRSEAERLDSYKILIEGSQ